MAKRRLKKGAARPVPRLIGGAGPANVLPHGNPLAHSTSKSVGAGGVAAMLVYATYFPADSTMVEQGDALWFCAFAFALLAWVGFLVMTRREGDSGSHNVDLFDASLFAIAIWMMVSAIGTSAIGKFTIGSSTLGNLRLATNESWVWVAGAATIYCVRRLAIAMVIRRPLVLLVVVLGSGLAVDALYQNFVTLPELRTAYRTDPDTILRQSGVYAPPNSSLRMVFENRLYDGGPSGTFALANSLAGFLVFALAALATLIRASWGKWKILDRFIGVALVALLLCATLATRSRSALAAVMVSVAIVFIASSVSTRSRGLAWMKWVIGLLGGSVLGITLIAMFGKSEWFSAAPASLQFRLEYWHSTWLMVKDHWIFGCGPGNFQSIYAQYQSNSGTEQIADPHNFFFESLASGGLVGAGLLAVSCVVGFQVSKRLRMKCRELSNGIARSVHEVQTAQDLSSQSVAWGAGVMLVVIWLGGLAVSNYPDMGAHRIAIPIAVGVAFWLWRSMSSLSSEMMDHAMTIALIGLMLHLTTAGGWTVPGISMLVWIGVGTLCRLNPTDRSLDEGLPSSLEVRSPIGIAAIGLLMALTYFSIRPVAAEKLAFSPIETAQQNRQNRKVETLLETAVQADGWAIRAPLFQCDFWHWQIVKATTRSPQLEKPKRWLEATKEVQDRCGQNPSAYRQLLTQAIHLYQVTGEEHYLEIADQWCEQAVKWAPSDAWMLAQHAEIKQALGDRKSAHAFAEKATRMSELGNNLEREMWLQQINVVEPNLPEARLQVITMQGYSILLDNF